MRLAIDILPAAAALCAALLCGGPAPAALETEKEHGMQIEYLEIVTPDVEPTCKALEKVHGVRFGAAVAELGNARTAKLAGGGTLGVRGPLRPDEEPVVRPYVLVEDIEKAVAAAKAAGGEIALPPMEIPGRGTCAIYFLGGIQHALWQR